MEAQMMDALDHAILRRLQQNGRQTNRDLAEAVGIAPSGPTVN
jgi:DNA-binding Lrp family transcriptional regulator